MFSWDTFQGLRDFYAGVFGAAYHFDHDHHHVEVSPAGLAQTIEVLKSDLGFLLLNDIAVVAAKDFPLYRRRDPAILWDVTYHLFQLESHQRLQVHVLLREGETLPSVLAWYPSAGLAEIEAQGYLRQEKSWVRPLELVLPPGNPNLSEPPYPSELHQWYLFDLLHPVTRGQGELLVESDEGRIINAKFQTGHWHRGWEVQAQGRTPLQMQPILDGLHPDGVALTNVAWMKTVEDFFLWRVPERAQAVRMLLMELSRCHHHLAVLKRLAVDLESSEGAQVCRDMIERIRALMALYSGARVATSTLAFGGLSHDLPPGWIQECAGVLESLAQAVPLYLKLVLRNPLCQRRLRVAGLSSQEALRLGLTGPALRAAGVNFDLRKSRPFYFYADIDFDVPVGMFGDAHDRGLIYCEEIYQSARISIQVLDNLPLGSVQADISGLSEFNSGHLPDELWRSWWGQADRVWGSQWTAVEGVDGELGFHLVLEPEHQRIWRLKIKSNAALLAQAVPSFLRGCPIANLAPALTSLNITASAVDR